MAPACTQCPDLLPANCVRHCLLRPCWPRQGILIVTHAATSAAIVYWHCVTATLPLTNSMVLPAAAILAQEHAGKLAAALTTAVHQCLAPGQYASPCMLINFLWTLALLGQLSADNWNFILPLLTAAPPEVRHL